MSASNVQPALSQTDWHLDIAYDAPSRLSVADPNIDDPVNDTGLGPQQGDLHRRRVPRVQAMRTRRRWFAGLRKP